MLLLIDNYDSFTYNLVQRLGELDPSIDLRNFRVMHGKTSPIHHDGLGVFRGLSNPFEATRYHSLVIRRETFANPDFVISAWTEEGEIMGVRHRTWPLHGVQFHPESFLTLEGPRLLKNFLEMRGPGG